MAEMTRSSVASILAPEFDDFLFAPIGEERNGMLLSVISALARLDVDPWQEAANLAELPRTTATRRLASLIAALPDRPSMQLDLGTIAGRLIALLPRRAGFPVSSVETSLGVRVSAVIQSPPFRYAAFLLMVVALSGLSVAVSQRSAARGNNVDLPASSTVISPAPSTSGR